MEPDERPVRGDLVRLKGVNLRPVADHERDAVLPQECIHLLVEPRGVPELEAMALTGAFETRERVRETVVVPLERRRQLPENRPHLRAPEERLDPLVEPVETLAELEQALDVCQIPGCLDREE